MSTEESSNDKQAAKAPNSLFGHNAKELQSTPDQHEEVQHEEAIIDAPIKQANNTAGTASNDRAVEEVVEATQIPTATKTVKRSSNIGDLYDEIEPEYKRLTQGDLDFDELDVNSLLTDWQSLKQADSREVRGEDVPTNELQSTTLVDHDETTNQIADQSTTLNNQKDSLKPKTVQKAVSMAQEDFAAPDVLVTSARTKPVMRPTSRQDHDNRPDAAKLEDLKRFAYAHGTKSAEPKIRSAQTSFTPAKSARPRSEATRSAKPVEDELDTNRPKEPTAPNDRNLSFSHASKVTKILGLKRDPLTASSSQQFGSSARSSAEFDPLQEIEDEEPDSDEESFFSASSKPLPSTGLQPTVRRQVSFRRTGSSSSIALAAEQTAKRALLIKAAHLEVCNHMIRTIRSQEAIPQGQNWFLVGLSGLSFWDRLAEIEKVKSQFTIIEIMRRYSFETQFSDALVDQISVRDLSFGARDTAMSLEPKTDLPLSTDLDNDVGRSKAAAEFIIEKLSVKLASGTFSDHEDNVVKVPIKDKSPLSRIQSDAEWRLVQDAVSAHALGRGYQVQMGDGPEEITRPWQVRQKEDLKDALLSLKWPSANELIWIKVNRLGIEH